MSDEEIIIACATALGRHQYLGVLYDGMRCTKCGAFIHDEVHNVLQVLTDPRASKLLIEALRKDDPFCHIHIENYATGDWRVHITGEKRSFDSRAPTFERAVALAFLTVAAWNAQVEPEQPTPAPDPTPDAVDSLYKDRFAAAALYAYAEAVLHYANNNQMTEAEHASLVEFSEEIRNEAKIAQSVGSQIPT